MAKLILHSFLTTTTLLLLLSSTSFSSAATKKPTSDGGFSTKLSREEFGLDKEEKLTRLHFYMSDFFGGENATAIPVTNVLDNNTFYGGIYLADDALTLGPELNSTSVGTGRGFYSFPSPNDFVLEMVYNLAFTHGAYNGSTLTLVGPIHPRSIVNELSIVGGTGDFRFGRGYAVAKRTVLDFQALLVVREFDVYVSHY